MPKRTSCFPPSPASKVPDLILRTAHPTRDVPVTLPMTSTMTSTMNSPRHPGRTLRSTLKYLLMAIFIVHDALVPVGAFSGLPEAYAAGKDKQLSRAGKSKADLTMPAAVEETRLLLLEAAQSGRLDELKGVAELNELKPDTGAAAGVELVAHWKGQSADGSGRDLLATITELLSRPPAVLRIGRDVENNRMFVWPHFADLPLKDLSSSDVEHLVAIHGTIDGDRMRGSGVYDGWRLSIGADGVWHRFRKGRD